MHTNAVLKKKSVEQDFINVNMNRIKATDPQIYIYVYISAKRSTPLIRKVHKANQTEWFTKEHGIWHKLACV